MQSDPILHAGGMNLYAYVGNDPVNRIDPLGLGDLPQIWCRSDGSGCISEPIGDPVPQTPRQEGIPWAGRGGMPGGGRAGRGEREIPPPSPRQCEAAEQKALDLGALLAPQFQGDLRERSTIAWNAGTSWAHGRVWEGPPDGTHVRGTGLDTIIPGGASFFDFHTHTLGRGVDNFLSQQDMLQARSYAGAFPSTYIGPYVGTHEGVFGPPWTDLGPVHVPGGEEHMYSGTRITCTPAQTGN